MSAPAPLTDPIIDCTNLDGFMLNVERLMASELWALSTGDEFKAAIALWCRAWKQRPAASLPADDRILAAFAGVPLTRFRKIRAVAMRGFVLCSDGRWYHPVLAADAARAWKAKEQRRKAIESRWGKRPKDGEEYGSDTSVPTAEPTEPIRPYYGTDTIDGTGRDESKNLSERASPASQHARALSPGWSPSPDDLAWCRRAKPDLTAPDIDRETEAFRLYQAEHAGTSHDWSASWKRWVQRARPAPMPTPGDNWKPRFPGDRPI